MEKIGIERAWEEIEQADRVLFMVDGTTTDATDPKEIWPDFVDRLADNIGMTVIRNKADQTNEEIGICHVNNPTLIRLSARTGQGVEALRHHLKECMGFAG